MKSHSWLVGGLLALVSVSSVATAAPRWGIKELKESEAYIVATYLKSVGAETEEEIAAAKNEIDSYSVKKGIQGTSASVSLTYKKDGVKQTINAFCHEHEPGEIDCH